MAICAKRDGAQSDVAPEPAVGRVVYAGSAAINLLALALPLTILHVYDRVLPNASFSTLNGLVVGLAAVVLIDLLLKYSRAHVLNWTAASYAHRTSTRALSAMLHSTPRVNRNIPVSKHLERLAAITGVGDFLSSNARIVVIDLAFIPIFALVILAVGGPIFLIPLTLFALFGFFAFRRTKRMRALQDASEQMETRKNDFIIEALQAMATIKSFAMEPLIMRRFERLQLGVSDALRQNIVLANAAQTFANGYASLSTVSIVGFGAVMVINDRLTIGGLACCMLLSSQLLQPLMRILSAWNEIQLTDYRRGVVAELFEDTKIDAPECTPVKTIVESPASVSIRNVTIRHGDRRPLFENLNLEIAPGALVAIRGEDGSGRTTLLRHLLGAEIPAEGEISIGGVRIAPETAHAIRGAVRYVGQDPVIFRGAIYDNLSIFGKTSTQDCTRASKLIGLDREIVRMPLGYDTPLGGATGQGIPAALAQQVSIARAIAARPALLVLDEANTLLDLPGESAFADALEVLKSEMTIILSTHRPGLIRLADIAYEAADGALTPIDANPPRLEARSS